jgi:hypothetical protein
MRAAILELALIGVEDPWGSAFVERPYKWSQRWFDDPPVGTTVVLGDGLVEVHVGGGVWETRKAVGES